MLENLKRLLFFSFLRVRCQRCRNGDGYQARKRSFIIIILRVGRAIEDVRDFWYPNLLFPCKVLLKYLSWYCCILHYRFSRGYENWSIFRDILWIIFSTCLHRIRLPLFSKRRYFFRLYLQKMKSCQVPKVAGKAQKACSGIPLLTATKFLMGFRIMRLFLCFHYIFKYCKIAQYSFWGFLCFHAQCNF